jgi:hypothetical protein
MSSTISEAQQQDDDDDDDDDDDYKPVWPRGLWAPSSEAWNVFKSTAYDMKTP